MLFGSMYALNDSCFGMHHLYVSQTSTFAFSARSKGQYSNRETHHQVLSIERIIKLVFVQHNLYMWGSMRLEKLRSPIPHFPAYIGLFLWKWTNMDQDFL